MAIKKDFSNTIADKKEKKKRLDKLTALNESDKNTIYHLVFSEGADKKDGQKA